MRTEIQWRAEGTQMPAIDTARMQEWIVEVARRHDRIVGPICYIFCDDDTILDVNRRFLSHDYYTDIITFDNTIGRMIRGDMYISVDTVRSNADLQGCSYDAELERVIIHGVLHLCGIGDKGPGEREVMEAHEDAALSLLHQG